MQNPVPPYQDPNQYQHPNQFQNQNTPPDPREEKIKATWRVVSLLYTLAVAGLAIYWEITDSGLAIIVREWQGSILGDSYYPALDILLCCIVLLTPLLIARFVIEKITGVKLVNHKLGR